MLLNVVFNLSPAGVLGLAVAYLALLVTAMVLVLKNEKGLLLFLWTILVLVLPFVGSGIYLVKHLLLHKKLKEENLTT